MMQGDVNVVTLSDGTVIGRVEPWADDPATFRAPGSAREREERDRRDHDT